MDKPKAFCTALAELMQAHGVTYIGGDYDNDSQGMYGEKFIFTMGQTDHVVSEQGLQADIQDLKEFE